MLPLGPSLVPLVWVARICSKSSRLNLISWVLRRSFSRLLSLVILASSFFLIPSNLSCSLLTLPQGGKVLLDHGYPVHRPQLGLLGNYGTLKVLLPLDQLLHLDNVAAQVAVEDGGLPGGHPALHGIRLLAPLEEVEVLVVDLLPETPALLHLLPPRVQHGDLLKDLRRHEMPGCHQLLSGTFESSEGILSRVELRLEFLVSSDQGLCPGEVGGQVW